MAELFGINFPTLMNDVFGGSELLDCTVSASAKASDGQGGFTMTYATPVAGKGVITDFSDFARAQGIPATDRSILIIQGSLAATPKRGDRVTILGQTYDIINVKQDPGEATWELQAR